MAASVPLPAARVDRLAASARALSVPARLRVRTHRTEDTTCTVRREAVRSPEWTVVLSSSFRSRLAAVQRLCRDLNQAEGRTALPWVRLDDHFSEHPKLVSAGPLGMALWVAGLAYSNRNLTDGFIPRGVAATLLDGEWVDEEGRVWRAAMTNGMAGEDFDCLALARHLVYVELWHEAPGGFSIHDYEEYQPSKVKVLEDREKAAQRMKKKRSGEVRENNDGSSEEVREKFNFPVPVPEVLSSEPKGSSHKDRELSETVEIVYAHWRKVFGKTRANYDKLSPARAKIIRSRLNDGFTVDELCLVFDTAAADDWKDRAKYAGIEQLLRSREKVEWWLDRSDAKPRCLWGNDRTKTQTHILRECSCEKCAAELESRVGS
jgi:hypothetical protein